MTPKELYEWAKRRKIEDAQIRLCDGMAITMYRKWNASPPAGTKLSSMFPRLKQSNTTTPNPGAKSLTRTTNEKPACVVPTRPGRGGPARPGCHLRTYAPAGSLGSAFAGLRRGAGRSRIAAGANRKERPAISALPCPVLPPSAVLLAGRTLSSSGAPRTASLSSAASAGLGRRLPGEEIFSSIGHRSI